MVSQAEKLLPYLMLPNWLGKRGNINYCWIVYQFNPNFLKRKIKNRIFWKRIEIDWTFVTIWTLILLRSWIKKYLQKMFLFLLTLSPSPNFFVCVIFNKTPWLYDWVCAFSIKIDSDPILIAQSLKLKMQKISI